MSSATARSCGSRRSTRPVSWRRIAAHDARAARGWPARPPICGAAAIVPPGSRRAVGLRSRSGRSDCLGEFAVYGGVEMAPKAQLLDGEAAADQAGGELLHDGSAGHPVERHRADGQQDRRRCPAPRGHQRSRCRPARGGDLADTSPLTSASVSVDLIASFRVDPLAFAGPLEALVSLRSLALSFFGTSTSRRR